MSLPKCLQPLLDQGKIKPGEGERARRAYDRHYRRLERSMAPAAAAAEASEAALREIEYENALKRRRTGLTIKAQQRMDADMAAAAARGQDGYGSLLTMLDQVEIGAQRLEGQAHARLTAFIERHRRNFLGKPHDRTGMIDVVRELHGDKTGNANARLFADAISGEFERLRQRFNRAGGDIGHRADYGMSHHHDSLRVRRAGYEVWRADILDAIDVERMVDPLSGGPFTAERLDEFLKASFENIRTGGMGGVGAAGGASSKMLANRRSDHRLFVFSDGESWLRYNGKYGAGNPFDAIIGHVRTMTRDIAFMERFGPNPAASWRRGLEAADRVDAQAARSGSGAVGGTSLGRYRADKTWRYLNGDFSVPVFPDGRLTGWIGRFATNGLAGTRDLLTAAKLGSAQLSAVTDLNTAMLARKMNALPQAAALTSWLKQLNPLDATHRRRSIRLGLGMRDASRMLLGMSRYVGETHGPRWTSVVADDVLRLSGLNKWTEAGQRAFGHDLLGRLAEERHLAFADLPEARRSAFDRYGIGEADWEAMRGAKVYEDGGAEFMDWQAIEALDQGAADRMMDMVLREGRAAVQEADAQAAAMMRFGRPGTVSGEIGAATTQFKSFPVALMMNQARRMAEIGRRHGPRALGIYAAQFLIGMTLFGAAALQLKEISKGRDMRPMDDLEFWADAFLQGGGLGIFGDVIGGFFSEREASVLSMAGGPTFGLGEDVKKWADNLFDDENEQGDENNPGRASVRMLKRYAPATTLWYGRAAFERLLWDQLAEEVDPDYRDSRRRIEEVAESQGTPYWWLPGEDLPERLPTLGESPE